MIQITFRERQAGGYSRTAQAGHTVDITLDKLAESKHLLQMILDAGLEVSITKEADNECKL